MLLAMRINMWSIRQFTLIPGVNDNLENASLVNLQQHEEG